MNAKATDEPELPTDGLGPGSRLTSVVARLSLANVVIAVTGFVAGPLQARALGPTGRGELAAIVVALTVVPQILGLALGTYAAREVASGRRTVNDLAGSLGLPLLLISVLGMAGAIPAAGALAHGDRTVETYLAIGLLLLPIALLGGLGLSILGGLKRWTLLIVTKLIPVLIPFVGIITLYFLDEMTVGRVAVLTLAAGVLSVVPAFMVIARAGRPIFRAAIAREGIHFGLRTWVGGLTQLANGRLDQLLMIGLVSSRELGLYAVAVTVAGLSNFFSGALAPPVAARVAAGDTAPVARVLRVALVAIAAMNVAIAAVTPFALPLLFGTAFEGAVYQALVLLAAGVPLAGGSVLAAALVADGAPGVPSVGEAVALAVTVPGLLILVPDLGGLGAAVVSLGAYTASFIFQLGAARRRMGGKLSAYLLPQREDARWARGLLPPVLSSRP